MISRKIIAFVLMAALLLPNLAFANISSEITVVDKIAVIEKTLYGAEQTGAILERTSKLEREIYGQETKDALVTKLDRLYAYTWENNAGVPSLTTKLNAVEWSITHDVTTQPAKAKLESLERLLVGNSAPGAIDSRVKKLLGISFPGGQFETANSLIGKDTLIKVKLVSPLDTRKSRVGDIIGFQAAEDVFIDDSLVIAKGGQGSGKVTKVEPSKNFGRDAKLEISLDALEAIDGTIVGTVIGEKAKEQTKSMAKAAGATVAGLVILGPVGVVGGAFIRGDEVTIPEGSQLYIQTSTDVNVTGIKVSKKAAN